MTNNGQEHKVLIAETQEFLKDLRVQKQLYSAAVAGLSSGIAVNIKKLDEYDLDSKMNPVVEDIAVAVADTLNQDIADAEGFEEALNESDKVEDQLLADDQLTPDDIPIDERHA